MQNEYMRTRTCCFTGHREISPAHEAVLPALLEANVRAMISRGINRFVAGGALGFDTLAAETVLALREDFPAVTLTVIAPYAGQSNGWSQADRLRYERIRSRATEFIVLSSRYSRGCMQKRNRAMVDMSSVCLAYLLHAPSGTSRTVDYAVQSGLSVANIADDIMIAPL